MEDLGKQIEYLIAQKKKKSKLPIEENKKVISSGDDIIASNENPKNLAKQKIEAQAPKKIESLKKKRKPPITEKQKNIFSVDDIIASKEKSAKLAREKLKNKIDITDISNKSIENKLTTSNKIDDNSSSKRVKNGFLKEVNHVLKRKRNKEISIKKIIDKSVSFISKKDIISKLRHTKSGHKQRVANIHVLTRTGDIEEIKATIPKSFAVCDFGKWYYGEGQMLAEFKEYRNLENVHQKIHDIYLRIFNLYKAKIVGSFFNSEKKQLKEREDKTILLAKNLDYQSDLFSKKLFLLEEVVKKLSSEKMTYLNI